MEAQLRDRLIKLRGEPCCAPDLEREARGIRKNEGFARALARHKALADEGRLLAFTMIRARGELCSCEVQAAIGVTHATASHHLAVLVDAGLLSSRKQGKWTYYSIAEESR